MEREESRLDEESDNQNTFSSSGPLCLMLLFDPTERSFLYASC